MDRYNYRRSQRRDRRYNSHRSQNSDVNHVSGTKRRHQPADANENKKMKKLDDWDVSSVVTIDLTVSPVKKKEKIKEKCPVCFCRFKNEKICTPNTCNHLFCIDCLSKWSENTNTCPIDRKRFKKIFVRETLDGPTIREIELNLVICDLCGKNDNEEKLVTCESCMISYHLYCLSLSSFTERQEWLCADCGFDRLVARIEID